MIATIVVPEGTVLGDGGHEQGSQTPCIMELIAQLTGESWGDAPSCVAPTLRSYCITLNDRMPDDVRQRLLPYVPHLVGTAPESHEVAQARVFLCADRTVRVFASLALEASGRTEDAGRLRSLPPIIDRATAREAAYAATDAAAYAYDAAAYAASEAASAAAAYAASAYAAYVASAASAAAAYAAAWDESLVLLDDLLEVTA